MDKDLSLHELSERIENLENEIAPIQKEIHTLQEQLISLIKLKQGLLEIRDKKIIDEMPSNIDDLTDESWSWILHTKNIQSQAHYYLQSNILRRLGFGSLGFFNETNQVALTISKRSKFVNTSKDIVKIRKDTNESDRYFLKKGFKTIKKYLKPIVSDNQIFETGIKIVIYDILSTGEDYNIFIHEQGDVVLYKGFNKIVQFKSFDDFVDYYYNESNEWSSF